MSAIGDSLSARGNRKATTQLMKSEQCLLQGYFFLLLLVQHNNLKRQIRKARIQFSDDTSKMGASLWLFITHLVLIMGFLGELSLWDSLQGIPTHPQVTRVSFCMNSKFPGFSPADVWKYNFTHHQQKCVCERLSWETFLKFLHTQGVQSAPTSYH